MNADIFEGKVAQHHPCPSVDDTTTDGNEGDDNYLDMCQAPTDVDDVCLPSVSAFVTDSCATLRVDTPAAVADSQIKSLFFSQEASSIFDKALEMHAAPANDPPMWGDSFEDFKEVADMLGDIGDISAGNRAFGDWDFSSTLHVDATSKNEPFDCFLGDFDAKINGEQSKSGHIALIRANGSNTETLKQVTVLPAHIMNINMDKRIFEDSMFVGDTTRVGCDSSMDSFFFGDDVPGMLNQNGRSMHAGKLRDQSSPIRPSPSGKRKSLDSPAPWPSQIEPTPPLPFVSPQHLNTPLISELAPGKSMAQISLGTQCSQLKANTLLGDLGGCSSFTSSYNHEVGAAAVGILPLHLHRPRQNNPCKGVSKGDAAWTRRFDELVSFKRQHGHYNVPQKFDKNPALGAWVARQRLMMRQEEDQHGEIHINVTDGKSLSTRERAQLLKNVGLESSIGKGALGKQCSRNTHEWEKQFSDLIKYRDKNGDCNVPTKCTSLGRWVSNQRKKYRFFLVDVGKEQDQAFGWRKELCNRFKRLKDIGFKFHLGKGKAQQKKIIQV